MAVGIVVRGLCGHLVDKWTDLPVVAVDSALKCVVPVTGGHHGANNLAFHLSKRLGLYPAVTTATDASGRLNLEGVSEKLGAQVVNRESSKDVNLAFLKQDVPVVRLKGPKVVLVDSDVAVLRAETGGGPGRQKRGQRMGGPGSPGSSPGGGRKEQGTTWGSWPLPGSNPMRRG